MEWNTRIVYVVCVLTVDIFRNKQLMSHSIYFVLISFGILSVYYMLKDQTMDSLRMLIITASLYVLFLIKIKDKRVIKIQEFIKTAKLIFKK
jgi:hypothetical protein